MAEILKLKNEEINDILEFIKDKLIQSKNINKLNITPKELIEKTMENIAPPTILIPAEIYTKMFALVMHSPVEISWHGLVKRDIKTNTYLIYDILVFPQINSPTTTTTDEKEFADWMTEKIIDPDFPIEDMRMHGHSHVNMNVFSSSVDDKYQEDLIAKVEDGDYYIFMVLNKRHDMCAFIYDYKQNVLFTTDDILIQVIDNTRVDIDYWASEQIEQLCKTAKTKKYNPGSYTSGDLYGYDDPYDLPLVKYSKSTRKRGK